MTKERDPLDVMPKPVTRAIAGLNTWFLIGGQAIRCLTPYRMTRDVDLGVGSSSDLEELLGLLSSKGAVEILEKTGDTVHLAFCSIKVSIFVLPEFLPFVSNRRLTMTGLLATKLNAIMSRGTRRDFFDLYILLQTARLGFAECLSAIEDVFGKPVKKTLLVRAITYFEDAESEAPLPGEGKNDWRTVKTYFQKMAGSMLVPPGKDLAIMKNVVDV